MTMQPRPTPDLEPGPTLASNAALLAGLEALPPIDSDDRRLVRVPVVIGFDDEYRLGLGEVFIGGRVADRAPDSVLLELDDTMLGVGVLDTIRDSCPAGEPACARWIDGYWGASPLVDILAEIVPEVAEGPKRWPFQVVAVGGPVEIPAGGSGALRVLVEAP